MKGGRVTRGTPGWRGRGCGSTQYSQTTRIFIEGMEVGVVKRGASWDGGPSARDPRAKEGDRVLRCWPGGIPVLVGGKWMNQYGLDP